uniref:RRM domain-containing protein n=1 Tax=Anopheles funestus TaxID=62324 RepID=A0A182RGV5_ANOFN
MAEISEKESGDVANTAVAATNSPEVKMETNAAEGKPKKIRRPLVGKGAGMIFIKHLPKGFNEAQLREFFRQFGAVAGVYLARSMRTQHCKGYGYVLFHYHEVAEIAASAVNNYMMFGRVLKATVLPRRMTRVPRNFGRACNSKGELSSACRKWLNRKVSRANRYLGPQARLERVSKQMKRLNRAERKLREAGIELPVAHNAMSKLKAQTKDLEEQVKENLAKRSALKKQTEMAVEQLVKDSKDENSGEGEEMAVEQVVKVKNENSGDGDDGDDDDDGENEDAETAFSMLLPSDWNVEEPIANEAAAGKANKEEAVKKALKVEKSFALAKSKANKPDATIKKENKKPVATIKKENKKPVATSKKENEKPVTTSKKENKKALPAKTQHEKAKLTLSKKKQSEVAAVPSLKTKTKGQQIAVAKSAKVVKSAKLGKKVK